MVREGCKEIQEEDPWWCAEAQQSVQMIRVVDSREVHHCAGKHVRSVKYQVASKRLRKSWSSICSSAIPYQCQGTLAAITGQAYCPPPKPLQTNAPGKSFVPKLTRVTDLALSNAAYSVVVDFRAQPCAHGHANSELVQNLRCTGRHGNGDCGESQQQDSELASKQQASCGARPIVPLNIVLGDG